MDAKGALSADLKHLRRNLAAASPRRHDDADATRDAST